MDELEKENLPYDPSLDTKEKIRLICEGMCSLLQYKNMNYGDAALNPLKIFSKLDAQEQIPTRLDDKISRIMHSKELRKNDVADVIGYCVLLCASKGWLKFDEFKD